MNAGAPSYRRASRSPIAHHPKLASFIVSAYETMTLAEVRNACRRKFGEEAVPSMSAISRLLRAVSKPDRHADN